MSDVGEEQTMSASAANDQGPVTTILDKLYPGFGEMKKPARFWCRVTFPKYESDVSLNRPTLSQRFRHVLERSDTKTILHTPYLKDHTILSKLCSKESRNALS